MRTLRSWITVLAATLSVFGAAACQVDDAADQPVSVVGASRDTARVHVDSAAGDVAGNDPVGGTPGKWLTDANVLSLLTTLIGKQIAAADVELQAWHSDTVRAFAAVVARDNAASQHSVDSVAARLHIALVAPALADSVNALLQAPIDSLKLVRGAPLDHAFIVQQLAAASVVARYADQLSAVAERPEIQAVAAAAAARANSEITRARAMIAQFRAADSLATAAGADSAAGRMARRKH